MESIADESNLKLQIAFTSLDIVGLLPWLIVNLLMLKIFVKYGKPLEDDQKTLI